MFEFDLTLTLVVVAAACGMAVGLFALFYHSED